MTAAAFDTLTAARDLEAAGIERSHAEAIAATVRTANAADREALATKADLAALETRLRADLRAEIGTIRWAVGLIAAFLFAIGLRVFGLI